MQVLHVGLGPLGRRIVADLERRGLGRVAAAVDPHAALVGRPLAEIVPGTDGGVRVVGSVPELDGLTRARVAVVTTRSDLALCMDTFRELLARGFTVVSTCEELVWPWLRHPVLSQELTELALRHDARLLGTGINPGFLMDALPVVATTVCHAVRAVRVERVQDASTRRVPFQEKIGVGLDEAEFRRRIAAGTLRHVGLGESLHFLAHQLGMRVERWSETIEPVFAERRLESALGPVLPGRARGVEQVARGACAEGRVIELFFRAALAEPEPRERIRIQGEPDVELLVPGGVHGDTATSAIVLNMLRSLSAAPPGLHTMASVALQGCAPPSDLQRARA
jgi:4-hydroxy-tetrahydrodipicolinate reductase